MTTSGLGCGKVILFGEHAVVHGQPALAAALQAGTRVTSLRPAPRFLVEVQGWTDQPTAPDDGTRLGESLARILRVVEGALGPVPPHRLQLRCDLFVGSGLGSSAAWAVAVAQSAALLARPGQLAPASLVLRAAEASERVFHGNPSGVDHSTSALGGLLLFQRGDPPVMQTLDIDPVPVIIAQMEPGADTGRMVAQVQSLLDEAPQATEPLLEALGALTRLALKALREADMPSLGRWMDVAHGALAALGVSTPGLDAGCHAARRAGAWGAKLTGAGGGGCMIAVAPLEHHPEVAAALHQAGAIEVLSTLAGVRRDDLVAPDLP